MLSSVAEAQLPLAAWGAPNAGDIPVGLDSADMGPSMATRWEQLTRACSQATQPGPALFRHLLTHVRVFLKPAVFY